jgi:hypothetical protein
MKSKRIRFYLLIIFLVLFGVNTASADQAITFKVPVKLNNLYTDVKSFSASCRVTTAANPAVLWAFGRTDINVSKNYDGIVDVPVKVPDSVASEVNYWVCEISLFHTGAGNGCTPKVDASTSVCKAKAGTQLVTRVEGPLSKSTSSVQRMQKIK